MSRNDSLGELFDPGAPLLKSTHFRPHWSQAGAIAFITFRTADSIPKCVLHRWEREKCDWIARETDVPCSDWRPAVSQLSRRLKAKFRKTFDRQRERYLDQSQGACPLRRPELAKIVHDALLHFDGVRYRMGDFIVMPNHVHLLASFQSSESLATQCDSWLHFTARQINIVLKRKGRLWQQEPFDHLVRSEKQYEYLRNYIINNGRKAGLRDDEYLLRIYQG